MKYVHLSDDGKTVAGVFGSPQDDGSGCVVLDDSDPRIVKYMEAEGARLANAPIYAALDEIDRKSIRPAREGDAARLSALEVQAAALRSQLVR